jgi:nucleoside-diphosphate-sugar epimerase
VIGKLFDLYFVELYSIKTMTLNLGCDIAKAKRELGYNPSISLRAGIKTTVDWIKSSYCQ